MNNEEVYKQLDKQLAIETFFNTWLSDFEIANPVGEFFLDPANNDGTLTCNIMSKLEFLLHTLEIFGLPAGYIDGAGHHLNWDEKKQAATRGKKKQKGGAAKKGSKLQKLQADIQAQKDALNKPPTYFDLEPFKKALKSFLTINAETRSSLRTQFVNNQELLTGVFKDEHNEPSFKRCLDIKELAPRLQQQGFAID